MLRWRSRSVDEILVHLVGTSGDLQLPSSLVVPKPAPSGALVLDGMRENHTLIFIIFSITWYVRALKVDAHGAHVRGTKESWGYQKAGWLFLYLFSVKLAGLFSNKCIRTELEYMQLWREVIEHRSRASVVYLISNWGWKHKIRIFVACWMCRKLRAF